MPMAEPGPPGSRPSVHGDGPRLDSSILCPVTPVTPEGVRTMRPPNPMTPEQREERSKKKAALIKEAWERGEYPTVFSSLLLSADDHDILQRRMDVASLPPYLRLYQSRRLRTHPPGPQLPL
jgi:hypothetical protein